MKTHPSRRRSGFTLVELLVVIAIIAVLAAAGFGAAALAMKRAKITKAKAMISSVEQAINAFYNEYGRLPDPSGSGLTSDSEPPLDTSSGDGVKLLNILMGKETGTDIQNTKSLNFLNVNEGKNKKDGIVYNGNQVEGLYDPFGSGYQIVLDGDYNEEITPPTNSSASTSSSNILRNRHCAVYSLGPEKTGKADAIKLW
ncbi:MAG: prepilin-type N-terminal cleavage/methylation domain-containing protein [Luteolibacter sp.]